MTDSCDCLKKTGRESVIGLIKLIIYVLDFCAYLNYYCVKVKVIYETQCCAIKVAKSEEERRIENIMGSGNQWKKEETRKICKEVTQADRNKKI